MTVSTRRTAVVTGGSRGIGKAVGRRLFEDGWNVLLVARSEADLTETIAELDSLGEGCVAAFSADIGAAGAPREIVDTALMRFAQLDLLVNNAAVNHHFGPAESVPEEVWSEMLDINLTGPFILCQEAASHMFGRGGGVIVNVTSLAATKPYPGATPYGVTKAALDYLTRALALEWASRGVRVNAVGPGTVETEMMEAALSREKVRRQLLEAIPTGCFTAAEEVAGAVAYLASPDAASVTGQSIYLDGGASIA